MKCATCGGTIAFWDEYTRWPQKGQQPLYTHPQCPPPPQHPVKGETIGKAASPVGRLLQRIIGGDFNGAKGLDGPFMRRSLAHARA